MNEILGKLALLREIIQKEGLVAIRLCGVDWFSWATGGGSNAVLLSSESGVAEVFVTNEHAFILTDVIEAERLRKEECADCYAVWECDWQSPEQRENFVRALAPPHDIASDRPHAGERHLPAKLQLARLCLGPEEIQRYRALGREASEAMSETLREARKDWTGFQLAARAAAALWRRGIYPALILVGDERRLPIYRQPTPSADRLGERSMLAVSARRAGLYANLSRFIYFRRPHEDEIHLRNAVAHVEDKAWQSSQSAATLAEVYAAIIKAYKECGFPNQHLKHHQGGTTGYLAREEIARANNKTHLKKGMALTWNPSLPGTRIEDTILLTETGLEVLTQDPEWPTFSVGTFLRPDYLVNL